LSLNNTTSSLLSMLRGDVSIMAILAMLVAIVISLTLHEYAHAFVAYKNGDSTAKVNGRLSINPLVHFDAVGFLSMAIVGFGFAKPVPVNVYNFKRRRTGIFTVAIAGVCVNFLLSFLCCIVYVLLLKLSINKPDLIYNLGYEFVINFFSFMSSLNLFLFFLNILPIFPLDGFRVVEAYTSNHNLYVRWMRKNGIFVIIGLFVLSALAQWIDRLPIYLDPLGAYLNYTAGNLWNAFTNMWIKVFF